MMKVGRRCWAQQALSCSLLDACSEREVPDWEWTAQEIWTTLAAVSFAAHAEKTARMQVGEEVLGTAAKVEVSKESTTIVGNGSSEDSVKARVRQIRNMIAETEQDYEKEKLNERVARLSGGVAIIQVWRPCPCLHRQLWWPARTHCSAKCSQSCEHLSALPCCRLFDIMSC